MKYWDSSAVVPLLVREEKTGPLIKLLGQDEGMIAWWGSDTECVSALARLGRQGDLSPADLSVALRRLDTLAASWVEIHPSPMIRETARRFLRVHPLRSADALQLAAAFVASEGRPSTLDLVCLDDRLADAAQHEGFRVLDRTILT